jgi:hypothetical protein
MDGAISGEQLEVHNAASSLGIDGSVACGWVVVRDTGCSGTRFCWRGVWPGDRASSLRLRSAGLRLRLLRLLPV